MSASVHRTHDWMVIYYYDHDHVEAQCTVVTASTGALRGQRVVRESDCEVHYAQPGRGDNRQAAGSPPG